MKYLQATVEDDNYATSSFNGKYTVTGTVTDGFKSMLNKRIEMVFSPAGFWRLVMTFAQNPSGESTVGRRDEYNELKIGAEFLRNLADQMVQKADKLPEYMRPRKQDQ